MHIHGVDASVTVSEPPAGTQGATVDVDDKALLAQEIAAGRWGRQEPCGTGWPEPEGLLHHVPHDADRQQAMLDKNIAAGAGAVGKARAEGRALH
jgi:hypothetical protein